MRVAIVGGENVANLINALKNEDADVLGCKMITDLPSTLRSSGKVDKVIVFDKGINVEPEKVAEIVKNINTIIVMNNEEELQNMSVEVFGNNMVNLVNNRGNDLTLFFLKDLITKDKIDEKLLYKPKVYGQDVDDDEDEEIVSQVKEAKEEIDEPVRRVIKQDQASSSDREENKERNFEIEEEKVDETVVRKASLVKEKKVEYNEIQDRKEDIRKILKLYGNSCVIGMAGTGNSGTTTMTYNLAYMTAKLGLTTLVLDYDFRKASLGYINKELFYEINDKSNMEVNEVLESMADGQAINHGYMIKENLMVVSSNLCCDIEQIAKYGEEIEKVINNARKNFDVIFIDTRLGDINRCPQILTNCDKIVYTIQHKNKSLFEFMRELVNINDPNVRKKVFKASVIWMGKSHGEGCLYSKTSKLECIDELLYNKFGIIDELKFADMIEVGTIPYIDGTDELIESKKTLYDVEKVRPYFEEIMYNMLNCREIY